MRKFFLLLSVALAMVFLNGCTYLLLWKYSTSETDDNLAEKRVSELEKEREERMMNNPNYRAEEISAYQKARGIQPANYSTVSTRPISTEELRARLEQQKKEQEKRERNGN